MVIIRHFQPADQPEAKQLILEGLAEHWGELDERLNPDLNDIASSYADAIVLVATDGEELTGTGVLKPVGEQQARQTTTKWKTAEVVRMSVKSTRRREGIGRRVLDALLAEGRHNMNIERVILETTASWAGVVSFYESYGFQITHCEDSPFGRNSYFEMLF